jgi:hypothetical protein
MTAHADRRTVLCTECKHERPHEAKGLCSTCYDRRRKTKNPARSRGRTAVGEAIGRLLPIPPMVRCAGAPGLACDRAARADVGRCWRCQPEAARAGVAA